jgi:hypothetical protein
MIKTTISSIVRSLATIPTELAHLIIDDLRVKDILKLLCHNDERVDACIVSHPVCRAMFGFSSDPDTLARTRFAAQFHNSFFKEVSPALSSKAGLESRWLPLNIHCIEPKNYKMIIVEMRENIRRELYLHWHQTDLTQLGAPDYPELARNSPPQDNYSFEDMKEWWEAIKKAKAILFKQRSTELHWAANMLEANPDILKRTLDPHQERRPNTAHIVSRMRKTADKTLRAVGQRLVASEHFEYEFFEITPFDSALVELLNLMQKHNITTGDQLTVDTVVGSNLAAPHPSSIQESARIVAGGMSLFHLSPLMTPKKRSEMRHSMVTNSDGMVIRTGNTPWSEEIELMDCVNVDGPYFTPHKLGTPRAFRRPDICQWDPHNLKEEEWLEAFVEVYRYLKGLK